MNTSTLCLTKQFVLEMFLSMGMNDHELSISQDLLDHDEDYRNRWTSPEWVDPKYLLP